MSSELFQSYAALLSMAVAPIYIGSHGSLYKDVEQEQMSRKDALIFPLVGSVVLFSLYMAFKFLSKDWINFLMANYFMVLGALAVGKVLQPLIKKFLPKSEPWKISIPVPTFFIDEGVWKIEFTLADVIGGIIGLVVAVFYVKTKHWTINNIFGLSFSIASIELINVGSYKTGALLLSGLFFYDIFWVFGTDVMVTVAQSFDVPIKLIWPRGKGYSLLGLGDIVIPGIFIALMLRFDKYLHDKRTGKLDKKTEDEKDETKDEEKEEKIEPFPKTYFNMCLVFYFIGLVVTILVLHVFKHGQPALLYLVPACLGSVTVLALVKGDFGELWSYGDEEEEEKKEEKTE